MKRTGIYRKIDNLGRIVIPKEIRNSLSVHNEDDIEFFLQNDEIILKKYSNDSISYLDVNKIFLLIKDNYKIDIYLSNKDVIINESDLYKKNIGNFLKDLLNKRKSYRSDYEDKQVFDNIEKKGYFYIQSLIKDGNINGLLIMIKDSAFHEIDIFLGNLLKNIIENQ